MADIQIGQEWEEKGEYQRWRPFTIIGIQPNAEPPHAQVRYVDGSESTVPLFTLLPNSSEFCRCVQK